MTEELKNKLMSEWIPTQDEMNGMIQRNKDAKRLCALASLDPNEIVRIDPGAFGRVRRVFAIEMELKQSPNN